MQCDVGIRVAVTYVCTTPHSCMMQIVQCIMHPSAPRWAVCAAAQMAAAVAAEVAIECLWMASRWWWWRTLRRAPRLRHAHGVVFSCALDTVWHVADGRWCEGLAVWAGWGLAACVWCVDALQVCSRQPVVRLHATKYKQCICNGIPCTELQSIALLRSLRPVHAHLHRHCAHFSDLGMAEYIHMHTDIVLQDNLCYLMCYFKEQLVVDQRTFSCGFFLSSTCCWVTGTIRAIKQ